MNTQAVTDRDRALTVPCGETRCNAQIGELCVNVHTGKPLAYQAAHLSRLKAAGVVYAPLDSRDLARGD